jgi:hypothetical protein
MGVNPRTGTSERIVLTHCTGTRPGFGWWGNDLLLLVLGLRYVFLMSSTHGRLWVLGVNPFAGCPNPRWSGQTRTLFKFRQPDDLFHALKTVKGMLHLVPTRTPRISRYGVLCTCGLCYMLFLLHF